MANGSWDDFVPVLRGREQELESLLGAAFGFSQILFPSSLVYSLGDVPQIALRYRGERLAGIDLLPGLDAELAARLRQQILQTIIEPVPSVVTRHFVFTGRAVHTYWREKDLFQLGPVPPHAPANWILGNRYPAVLELPYAKLHDLMADGERRAFQLRQHVAILSLLLDGGLTCTPRTSTGAWVIVMRGPTEWETVCGQVGYAVDGWEFEAPDFRPVPEGASMRMADPLEYFSRWGVTLSDPGLDAFQGAGELFTAYFALPPKDRVRFQRACLWLNMWFDVHHTSPSLSLLCVTTALECVQTKASRRYKEAFVELLDRYAPGIDRTLKGDLYDLRSRLSHGDMLLLSDVRTGMNPFELAEGMKPVEAYRIARVVLVNWLNAQAHAAQEHRG